MNDEVEDLKRELEATRRALTAAEARQAQQDTEYNGTVTTKSEDIRKKNEQKEQEWMLALDVVNDPIFLHDGNFRILRCNKAYQQRAGLPFKQIIGQQYYDIFPKTHSPLPGCTTAVEEAQKERGVRGGEEEVTNGDSSFRSRAFTVHGEQGEYLYSMHILEDITRRRQTERALQESEELLRRTTDSARDAIITLEGEQGTITTWNPAAETIFGYSKEEMIGRVLHELLAPQGSREQATHGLTHFATTGEGMAVGQTLELVALHKNGTEFPIELSLSATKLHGKWYATGIARDISDRKQAVAALNHANRALATLGAVNRQLVYATNEDELLNAICQAIVEQRGYRMASVIYAHTHTDKNLRVMAHALHDGDSQNAMQLAWGNAEYGIQPISVAIRNGKTQVCQDIVNDPDYLSWHDLALKHGNVSCITLPMMNADNAVFGVLTVFSDEKNTFIPTEIALLEEMAADMAFGVRTLRMRQERNHALEQIQAQMLQVENNLEDTVMAIASIVEMRDPYTAGHQARVANLAVAIANQMGLPDEQIRGLRLAGAIHDLGKIQVPAEILSKPMRLNALEYEMIKTHSQAGYDILKGIDFSWPVAQAVWQHHERIDGSGYPQGLKGDAILLEARILCVADVVEAMASHRPYRPGLGIDTALNEIKTGKGTLYDPVVADACLEVFNNGLFKF